MVEAKVCNGFRAFKLATTNPPARRALTSTIDVQKNIAKTVLRGARLDRYIPLLDKVDAEFIDQTLKFIGSINTGMNPAFCLKTTAKDKKNHRSFVKYAANNLDITILDTMVKSFMGKKVYDEILKQINLENESKQYKSLVEVLEDPDPNLDKEKMLKRFYDDYDNGMRKKIKQFNDPKKILKFGLEAAKNLETFKGMEEKIQKMEGKIGDVEGKLKEAKNNVNSGRAEAEKKIKEAKNNVNSGRAEAEKKIKEVKENIEKKKQEAKEKVEEAKEKVEETKQQAKEKVEETKQQAKEKVEETKQQAKEKVEEAKQKAEETKQQAKEKAEETKKQAEQEVKKTKEKAQKAKKQAEKEVKKAQKAGKRTRKKRKKRRKTRKKRKRKRKTRKKRKKNKSRRRRKN